MATSTCERAAGSLEAQDQPASIPHMPAWLLNQAGITPPGNEQPLELTQDGATLLGDVLIAITDTFTDTSARATKSAQGVVEALIAGGIGAARRSYSTANDDWLAERVSQFGEMVRSAGEEVGGPEGLRGMVLRKIATARGITLSGAQPVAEILSDLLVPAPRVPLENQIEVADAISDPPVRKTRRSQPRGGAPKRARITPQPAPTEVAQTASDDDEEDLGEPVDDEAVEREINEMVAKLEEGGKKARGGADDEPDPVGTYLKEISRRPLLTVEQEVELAKRIEAGVFAEKILEVSALMGTGDVSDADKKELVLAAYHGMDKHGRKRNVETIVDETKLNPERMLKAGEQVDILISHVKSRLHPDGTGKHTLDPVHFAELEQVAGDGKAAKNEMAEANLKLVVYFVKRFPKANHLQQLDMIQEGSLGLIHAIEKFDYTLGNKFSTYASWWIKQAVKRGLNDGDRDIRLPMHVHEQIAKLGRVERELETRHGRSVSRAEIAAEMDITEDKIDELMRVRLTTASLDETIGDSDRTLHDVVADKMQAADSDGEISLDLGYIAGLSELLPGVLSDAELSLANLLFGFNDNPQYNISEITELLGLSRTTVRSSKTRILLKLLHPSSPTRPIIMEALGVDEDALSVLDTPCKSTPTSEYFPTAANNVLARKCGDCALWQTCRQEGTELGRRIGTQQFNQFGIWGGASAAQRQSAARNSSDPMDNVSATSPLLSMLAKSA